MLKGAIDALATLQKSDFSKKADGRVITLINGTGAGPFVAKSEAALSLFGQVLVEPKNVGISTGRNLILRQMEIDGWAPDYVLEIHNDMIFPLTWFGPLLDAMNSHKYLGVVSPALLTPVGYFGGPKVGLDLKWDADRLQAEVTMRAAQYKHYFSDRRPRLRRGLTHPVLKFYDAMKDAGLEYDDQNFPGQNFEDTDEVWRMENAGYEVKVSLDSIVYHHYHFSRLGVDTQGFFKRNSEAFLAKYGWTEGQQWLRKWDRSLNSMYLIEEAVDALPTMRRAKAKTASSE